MEAREFRTGLADEIAHLRGQLNANLAEARSLERYLLLLTGGVWAWLATHTQAPLPRLVWWVPAILTFLVIIREVALYLEIRRLSGYIARKEIVVVGENGGWETHVAGSTWTLHARYRVPIAAGLFWMLLLTTTCLAPFWLANR